MNKGDFILQNGKLVSESNVEIGSQNRSFRYGDGLFETLRSVDSKIPFWDFHIQRLKSGLDILEMDYKHIRFDELKVQLIELLRENTHDKSARVRLSFFRADGGNYFPLDNKANYIAETYKLDNREFELNKVGLNTDVFTRVKKPVNVLSMIKSANAQLFVMAGRFAQANNMDEVFLVNQNNELCEAVSSNFYVIKDNKIFTPALSSGCLPGVTRMVVNNILAKKGVKVAETKISPSDLILADEIFLTNSIQGISWVGGYQTKRYYKKYSELILKELNQVFLNSK